MGEDRSTLKKENYCLEKSNKSRSKRKENCMKTVRRSKLKIKYQTVTVTRCTFFGVRGAESVSVEPEETSVQAISVGLR